MFAEELIMDISNAEASSVYNYATEQAKAIVQLHFIDLIVCFVIAMTVIGLLTYVAIKFRQRADIDPPQYTGNLALEITWTAIPALILMVMAVLTAITMHSVNPPVGNRQPDVIENAH